MRVIICSAVLAAIAACLGERGPFPNRMAQSRTSYLVRAARQPVRWQPWGREAFALAAKLDRPVLLYIGSDLCRWCAESDRDIYMNPEIGAMINSLFVPVRVDRDERPDIAQLYQATVEHLAGLRGWPLTVFLTDDGSAFFGGTYFPGDDPTTGRGLKQLLPEIARSYHEQRPSIVQQAALLRQLVRRNSERRGALQPTLVQQGLTVVRQQLEDAVRNRTTDGSGAYVRAAALLLSGDSASRVVAVKALELMLDSTAASALETEDPPRLIRAALAATLASAWTVTGDVRYREYARGLTRDLVDTLVAGAGVGGGGRGGGVGGMYADQEAYVLEHALLAAATLGETAVVGRAAHALELLLQRTYARGWGVRHAIASTPAAGRGIASAIPASLGLLRDQIHVAAACIAAYQVTRDSQYLDVAIDLAGVVDRTYADSLGGYFDVTDAATHSTLPLGEHTKQLWDDVLPAPNAEAALVLAQLASVTRDPIRSAIYRRRARQTLEAFAGAAAGTGIGSTTFLAAARKTLEIR